MQTVAAASALGSLAAWRDRCLRLPFEPSNLKSNMMKYLQQVLSNFCLDLRNLYFSNEKWAVKYDYITIKM